MANFNKLINSILEQMGTPPQPNQPAPPQPATNKPLDTKSLADQISKLDPSKIDPEHQKLLTALQQALAQQGTQAPVNNNQNAVNQPNQNGQKQM
jgi:hypothetical protein